MQMLSRYANALYYSSCKYCNNKYLICGLGVKILIKFLLIGSSLR